VKEWRYIIPDTILEKTYVLYNLKMGVTEVIFGFGKTF